MNIQALAFDTGGPVLDWHSGLVRALAGVGAQHRIERDWHAMANDRRRHARSPRPRRHAAGPPRWRFSVAFDAIAGGRGSRP